MMLEPFLKWAGGKRWFAQEWNHLFPSTFNRYVEPFLGGGAVYFHLLPRRALLGDMNAELINAYRCVRSHADYIDLRLRRLHKSHSAQQYYRVRATEYDDPVDRAVRFIYLNRTCFNGLYRVNRRGDFNVPIGCKTLVEYPAGYLADIARMLRRASFKVADFEGVLADTREGDFVFLDPPYTVMHNKNDFIRYNSALFSWQDQIRLAEAARQAVARGALVMVTNADHVSVRALYRGFPNQRSVGRLSRLASSANYRRRTTELVVTSY